jgi:hypothetical protein
MRPVQQRLPALVPEAQTPPSTCRNGRRSAPQSMPPRFMFMPERELAPYRSGIVFEQWLHGSVDDLARSCVTWSGTYAFRPLTHRRAPTYNRSAAYPRKGNCRHASRSRRPA